jgi:transposase InsO family protein
MSPRTTPTGRGQVWVSALISVLTVEGWLYAAAGIQPSMSRPGNLYDNAAMEGWMATDQRECVALAVQTGGYTADFLLRRAGAKRRQPQANLR